MPHDVLIVGAGPVGMALAVALKDAGLDTVLVDARPRGAARGDPRVLALAHGTRLTLQRLGVWEGLSATPIRHIHVSQAGGFGRTRIEAAEHHLDALGYVVRAGELAGALDDRVRDAAIPVIDGCAVAHLAPGSDDVIVSLDGEPERAVRARLVACAEGGVQGGDDAIGGRDYGQHAVITVATPADEHGHLAFERFTPDGPLALLPCGRDYAVVHTTSPRGAERLLAMDEREYLDEVERCMAGRVRLTRVEPRQRFPLALRYRRDPVGDRTVWLGNAAQTLHPVAGQGFNLALRDVWALASLLRTAPAGADPGDAALLSRYRSARRVDRGATIGTTDTLVRLFSNDLAPLKALRGAGLLLLDACPPLRGALARRMMFGARAWP